MKTFPVLKNIYFHQQSLKIQDVPKLENIFHRHFKYVLLTTEFFECPHLHLFSLNNNMFFVSLIFRSFSVTYLNLNVFIKSFLRTTCMYFLLNLSPELFAGSQKLFYDRGLATCGHNCEKVSGLWSRGHTSHHHFQFRFRCIGLEVARVSMLACQCYCLDLDSA